MHPAAEPALRTNALAMLSALNSDVTELSCTVAFHSTLEGVGLELNLSGCTPRRVYVLEILDAGACTDVASARHGHPQRILLDRRDTEPRLFAC